MKRILLVLALVVATTSFAQTAADTVADSLLRHEGYTELNRILRADAEFSPAMQLRAEATVASRLRRFDESNALIDKLITSPELMAATPPEALSELAAMMGTNYRHSGDYASAAELYRSFAEQYPVESEDYQSLTFAAEYFERWAAQPRTTIERASEMVEVPFRIDSAMRGQIIRIEAEVNGRMTEMIFDTGCAEMSFADEQFARDHNLRDTGITLNINGVGGNGTGRLAMADSIRVGGLTLRNAMFAISPDEGIRMRDGSLFRLGGVLGCNFILAAEVFEFDNETRTIRFPAPESVLRDDEAANMWMNDSGLFYVEAEVGGHPATMQFDTGNAKSNLTSVYYHKHRDEVEASGVRGTVGMSGFGGMVTGEGFRMPEVGLEVDGAAATLRNTQVTPDIAGAHEEGEDGALGVDFMTAYPRIRVDYRAMRISVLSERREMPTADPADAHIESPKYKARKTEVWQSKNRRAGVSVKTNSPVDNF